MTLKEKVLEAYNKDTEIITDKEKVQETLGTDAKYLDEVLGLTKKDLMKLEKKGLALRARYQTEGKKYYPLMVGKEEGNPQIQKVPITGPHRIRWIIFKGALE